MGKESWDGVDKDGYRGVGKYVLDFMLGYRIGEDALNYKTYLVAKEQISRTENLWLYLCEDRGM